MFGQGPGSSLRGWWSPLVLLLLLLSSATSLSLSLSLYPETASLPFFYFPFSLPPLPPPLSLSLSLSLYPSPCSCSPLSIHLPLCFPSLSPCFCSALSPPPARFLLSLVSGLLCSLTLSPPFFLLSLLSLLPLFLLSLSVSPLVSAPYCLSFSPLVSAPSCLSLYYPLFLFSLSLSVSVPPCLALSFCPLVSALSLSLSLSLCFLPNRFPPERVSKGGGMDETKKGGSWLQTESRGSRFALFEHPNINININPPSNPDHPQLCNSNNSTLPTGEKDAMTRDLLSLCGKNASGEQVAEAQDPASSVMAQDISHLMEKGNAMATMLPHVLIPTAVPVNELSFRAGSEDNCALVKGASQAALPSNIIFHMGGRENGNINGVEGRLGNPITYWPGVQLNFGTPDLHSSVKSTQSQSQYQMDLEPHYPSTLSKKCQRVSPEYVDTGKRCTQVQSDEDDEDDEGSPQQSSDQKKDMALSEGDPSQTLDGRVHDVKGRTLRSKHSATEQRRRTRINERFQMLRQLVPNYDQKRDKASFLLEVIEYIQNLQEKVRKYESMEYSGRQDRMENMPWVLGQRSNGLREVTTNSNLANSNPTLLQKECSHGKEPVISSASALSFHSKDDDWTLQSRMKNISMQLNDPEISMDQSIHHLHLDYESKYHTLTKPTMPFPSSSSQVLSEVANGRTSSQLCVPRAISEPTVPSSIKSGARSDLESVALHELNRRINDPRQSESRFEEAPQALITGLKPLREIQLSGVSAKSNRDAISANGVVPKDSETDGQELLSINGGGVINVSSAYSQGLLNTLAHAIQISGLDLSKASISVQVDLGKDGISTASTSSLKVEALQQSPCHQQNFRASLEPEIPAKRQKVEG